MISMEVVPMDGLLMEVVSHSWLCVVDSGAVKRQLCFKRVEVICVIMKCLFLSTCVCPRV